MIRFLTDENFNNAVIQGIRKRLPVLDILRVQDAGLRTFRDEIILEFAASEGRVVLTHDIKTMGPHAVARLSVGMAMPGLLLIKQNLPIGQAIDENCRDRGV